MLGNLDDQAALENFAYGDTPTEAALRSLLDEVLEAGPSFDVAPVELSNRHDIRLLVLRTALTYLELLGVLRQGTPFYAEYKARPLVPLEAIIARFSGERAQFLQDIFTHAKKGREWYTLTLDQLAAVLRQERQRLVRALEYLAEQGYDRDYGARPLRRVVQTMVEDRLAEGLLRRLVKPGDSVLVDRGKRDGLLFRTAAAALALSGDQPHQLEQPQ